MDILVILDIPFTLATSDLGYFGHFGYYSLFRHFRHFRWFKYFQLAQLCTTVVLLILTVYFFESQISGHLLPIYFITKSKWSSLNLMLHLFALSMAIYYDFDKDITNFKIWNMFGNMVGYDQLTTSLSRQKQYKHILYIQVWLSLTVCENCKVDNPFLEKIKKKRRTERKKKCC